MNEEQKWKTLVKITHARYDLTKNMLKCDRDKQDAILWADAELTRLRAELSEATDACNGLHEMVKDLQKDNARLSAIAARVEDVELIASEFVYKHTVSYLAPCKTRSLRWDELTEEQKEPYREDARAISAWAKEG